MAELQAAFALTQLPLLNVVVQRRRGVFVEYEHAFARYSALFRCLPHDLPNSSVWRVAVRPVPSRPRGWRDAFIEEMGRREVEVLPGFTSLTVLPPFGADGQCPVAESLEDVFVVPCHANLTEDAVDVIVKTMIDAARGL